MDGCVYLKWHWLDKATVSALAPGPYLSSFSCGIYSDVKTWMRMPLNVFFPFLFNHTLSQLEMAAWSVILSTMCSMKVLLRFTGFSQTFSFLTMLHFVDDKWKRKKNNSSSHSPSCILWYWKQTKKDFLYFVDHLSCQQPSNSPSFSSFMVRGTGLYFTKINYWGFQTQNRYYEFVCAIKSRKTLVLSVSDNGGAAANIDTSLQPPWPCAGG